MTRYVVIGGGIVGLATAYALRETGQLTLLEKETELAQHQTGRNSGVLHSGIYYPPGSAKAELCRAGATSMARFAEDHNIAVNHCGKLIVASTENELPGLRKLYERGLANGVSVRQLSPEQAREHEPFVAAVGALHVANTASIDFPGVCRALAAELVASGADLRRATTVTSVEARRASTVLHTTGPHAAELEADVMINCAGLQADRIARWDGVEQSAKIVPFRGEYYELKPERAYLVKGLIYPVPDPDFPFLGVHLTRNVGGVVHAGPNAVLALAREGYRWSTARPRDVVDTLAFPGFWRLAQANARTGLMEIRRSLSRRSFAASLARLVPGITADDLVPAVAGVRAQALHRDGRLVDDFLIQRRGRNVHVLNAPSPAATSALEIGRRIATLATTTA